MPSIRVVSCRSSSSALALAALTGCTGGTQPLAPKPQAPASAEVATPPAPDPYHPAPQDTVDAVAYDGWKQYGLHCSRCHGEEAQGSSFGPSLLAALKPDGAVPDEARFVSLLTDGRPSKGMPSAAKMGLDSTCFAGLYRYLKGRSDGVLRGGRPARRAG